MGRAGIKRVSPRLIELARTRTTATPGADVGGRASVTIKRPGDCGEVAIAWTLRNTAVTAAIVGARNARQAEQVMRAGELLLSDEEVNEIEAFAAIAA